jgi:hypothetical protein
MTFMLTLFFLYKPHPSMKPRLHRRFSKLKNFTNLYEAALLYEAAVFTSALLSTKNIPKPSVLACSALNDSNYDCSESYDEYRNEKHARLNDSRKKFYENSPIYS